MNTYTNKNSAFPSQVVSDEEKNSLEYGTRVAQAIQGEWWTQGGEGNRFASSFNRFHSLRLYARGEQPVQKYKDELSINGDMSYLNLDWKPVAVVSKFVDIVVNGMSQKDYKIKAYAQDPSSMKQRTKYAQSLLKDMKAKPFTDAVKQTLGFDLTENDPAIIPETQEELDLHMQLTYKQSVEIAEEEVINNVLDRNKFDVLKRRFNYDLTVLGIGAVKTNWNKANGIRLEYVDPSKLIYSYTDDPNFEDIYYVGEVKSLTIPEIKKQFPNLTSEQLEKIQDQGSSNRSQTFGWQTYDRNTIQILFFEYKTYNDQVFKIKNTEQGLLKALEKPSTFNPPENDGFERVSRTIEVLYKGAKVLGNNEMLQWELAENMTRPTADTTKVEMSYSICAPRMYLGKVDSLVSKITGFADMIQLTHLKLQQVMSRIVPDGVFLDMDGLAEVDLGNGTNYNPAEALNMYFQTGSIVGRSLTQEGDMNRGKVPIQELSSSSGQQKIQSLIQTYQYYLQMIRDVTGLNEARDGSAPDKDTLVGLQKMAANASNIATRHILDASLWLTLRTCENISLKVADSIQYPLTLNSLLNSISVYNTETLKEISNLNLHDFGIFLELEPEEEEKQMLEQNIQVALQSGGIDLEDAIDLRQIRNLQLANDMLKIKRKKKQEQDRAQQEQMIKSQANANAETAERAAMAEVQKNQALTEQEVNVNQSKSQMEMQRMQMASQIKQQEMEIKFGYDLQLANVQLSAVKEKEQFIEDRKDKRTQIQATQQSEMISQRQNDSMAKNFESSPTMGGFGAQELAPQ
jgi:hypothetical protein